MFDVVCVGILVADVIAKTVDKVPESGKLGLVDSIRLHNGGGAMSCAIDLAKIGAKSAIIGKVGEDGFGQYLTGVLVQHGVNVSGLAVDNKVDTSSSVVLIETSGERTFLHCQGSNGAFKEEDIDYSVIEKSKIAFISGSLLMRSFDGVPTETALKKIKEMGKTTVLDTAWDDSGRWMEVIGQTLKYVDYFIPSLEEAEKLAGEKDLDKIANAFFNYGVSHVVIKLGKRGCYFRENIDSVGKIISTYKAKVVDTTGAGDSFCSGFLYGLVNGMSMEESCRFGNAVGTFCVQEVGATSGIKSYKEIKEFMNNNNGLEC